MTCMMDPKDSKGRPCEEWEVLHSQERQHKYKDPERKVSLMRWKKERPV